MTKKELLDKLLELSKSSPKKTSEVFHVCMELYRWQKKVPELEVSDGQDADAVFAKVQALRQRLIDLVE